MNPPLNRALAGLLAVACALLAACGTDAPPAPAQPAARVSASPSPVAIPPAAGPATKPDPKRIAALLAIAQEDFVAGRYVSPPDANALQGYLDVRALDPDNPHVREALVDLYPFAAQKAELALAGGDTVEAARIVALLELAAPEALGLAELGQRVSAAQAPPVFEGPPEAPPADPAAVPVAGDPATLPAPGEAPAEATPQQ